MQIERFDRFVEEVSTDFSIVQDSLTVKIYRYFDEKWYDQNNEIVTEESLLRNLTSTRRRRSDWRHKADAYSYFMIKDLDAVSEGSMWSPCRLQCPKRDRLLSSRT